MPPVLHACKQGYNPAIIQEAIDKLDAFQVQVSEGPCSIRSSSSAPPVQAWTTVLHALCSPALACAATCESIPGHEGMTPSTQSPAAGACMAVQGAVSASQACFTAAAVRGAGPAVRLHRLPTARHARGAAGATCAALPVGLSVSSSSGSGLRAAVSHKSCVWCMHLGLQHSQCHSHTANSVGAP